MPLYEFECQECQHVFETLMRYDDLEEVIECPACTSGHVRRLISNTAPPQFKGSGFYSTDYKKKSGPKES